jgi:hypothetical protein
MPDGFDGPAPPHLKLVVSNKPSVEKPVINDEPDPPA